LSFAADGDESAADWRQGVRNLHAPGGETLTRYQDAIRASVEWGDWFDVPVFGDVPSHGRAIRRDSAYTIIRDGAGNVAVVRTPKGVFLPGGGVDADEPPIDAVHREVREECGLGIRIGDWQTRAIEFVHSPTERTTFEKRSIFFEARITTSHEDAIELDHALDWLPAQTALAALTPPSHRWALARWHETLPKRDAAER
jgi:8-oxo-dGTP diphosphatase